jgi:hypothetical protein
MTFGEVAEMEVVLRLDAPTDVPNGPLPGPDTDAREEEEDIAEVA